MNKAPHFVWDTEQKKLFSNAGKTKKSVDFLMILIVI